MFKWLFFILVLLPKILLSQDHYVTNGRSQDSVLFTGYYDRANRIYFEYPKNWDTSNVYPINIFTAREGLKDSSDKYREQIYYGSGIRPERLRNFMKQLARAIKAQNRKKIQIESNTIASNFNRVEYGILINTSIEPSFIGRRTHMYFVKNYSLFRLIFSNDLSKDENYTWIFSYIIQSVKFVDGIFP